MMCRESGDHVGDSLLPIDCVKGRAPLPSGFMIHNSSPWPSRSTIYAIDRPSGDHVASYALPPWNETRWVDKEFSALLDRANATLDVEERRKIFCKLEDIQMSRGSIGIAWWRNVWMVTAKKVQDVKGHPTLYMLFNKVWLKG